MLTDHRSPAGCSLITTHHTTDMKQTELDQILKAHKQWLKGSSDGVRANLRYADLSYANLRYAILRYADLSYANLSGANLRDAKGLPIASDSQQRLRAVASEVLAFPNSLQMGVWHGDCGTTHCLAGWAIHHAGPIGEVLEKLHGPHMAGLLLLGVDAAEHFYDRNDDAIAWLQSVAQEAT